MKVRRSIIWASLAAAALLSCEAIAPILATLGGNLAATALRNHGQTEIAQGVETLQQHLKMYTGETPEADPTQPPLQLTVRMLKQEPSSDEWVPITDGDVLLSGGTQATSDWFTIEAVPSQDCWFYAVTYDATAFPTALFPKPGASARVPGGQPVPIGKYWLDRYYGKETFYFVASSKRREDLERLMAEWPAQRPAGDYEARVEPAEEDYIERGVSERGSVDGRGVTEGVPAEVFRAKSGDLAITRWFWHRER